MFRKRCEPLDKSGFSALQRAENSSMPETELLHIWEPCFSALQRAENSSMVEGGVYTPTRATRFSALQRAENSSMFERAAKRDVAVRAAFQCSSASRKFLNPITADVLATGAEVSVLFSEPKIPQCVRCPTRPVDDKVSVLFSEPKIPQYGGRAGVSRRTAGFSALQRAENSSMQSRFRRSPDATFVSVLFSEPKIPQFGDFSGDGDGDGVSVLFSEPKIPQFAGCAVTASRVSKFQCSSASRKFLNLRRSEEEE